MITKATGTSSAARAIPASEPRKKAYRTPELTEWGSILDLTEGPTGGLVDFPGAGTQPDFR